MDLPEWSSISCSHGSMGECPPLTAAVEMKIAVFSKAGLSDRWPVKVPVWVYRYYYESRLRYENVDNKVKVFWLKDYIKTRLADPQEQANLANYLLRETEGG